MAFQRSRGVGILFDPAPADIALSGYRDALRKIACGRTDNGRPLGGDTAREIAREVLTSAGDKWSGIR